MQVDQFYSNDINKAVKIKIINQASLQDLPEFTKALLTSLNFQAKSGEVAPMLDINGDIIEFLIGAGEEGDVDFLAKSIKKLPEGKYKLSTDLAESILLSWALEQYKFNKYLKHQEQPRILYLPEHIYPKVINKAAAIYLIRDLINTPTCDMGPEALAETLQKIAKNHSGKFSEVVGEDLMKKNYPAIYTVGKGSSSKPRLLFLTWGNDKHPKLTLVGKGVCFDSGGLNLKSTAGLALMKKDMGGAAHVLGLAQWIMSENLPVKLQVIVPAVENSVDGNAYRPGDVIIMRNGLSVEVLNTDAEGRLVLGDALTKACEDMPDLLIDFATLTGAARIAVGTEIAAMFTNDDDLANKMFKYGEECKDSVWRMPLASQYESLYESKIADIANDGSNGYAGAITAALFLQRFINKNIPWVHFDIMAWNLSAKPGKPIGGEALGFLAMTHFLKDKYLTN